jgi:hypothetical protein
MKNMKKIAGIIWAFLGLILIIILFPQLNGFSKSLAGMPFMKINQNYTGGAVAFKEITPACTLVVHKPVFSGLVRERKEGFVQVDWKGKIPEQISDTIDYDRDGKTDFYVNIDTRKNAVKLTPVGKNVRKVNVSTPTSYGWTVRVNLEKN